MKISIITPSYNQGKFIAQTFESILSQGIVGMEYIVMDGGSTDSTISVIKKYAPLFKQEGILFKYFSEKDNGQSDAINKGWSQALGNIITYINSDDYYEKDALKKILKFFKDNPETMWAYGGWNFVNKTGQMYKSVQPTKFVKQKLLNYCNIGQPSCFFRRKLLKEVGLLNEDLHLTMDYDLWLRFATKYPAGIIDSVVSNMRYYSDAKSGTRTMDHLKEALALSKKYSKPFSLQRVRQLYFFARGYIVILLKRDITHRVGSKKYL